MALRTRPIERWRVFEEIVERIEEMPVAGDLKPGDRLPPERDLMRIFQVGRTSPRRARRAWSPILRALPDSAWRASPACAGRSGQAMQDHLAEVERCYRKARRIDGAQAGGP